jgi:Protein of unknown function (DUF551)
MMKWIKTSIRTPNNHEKVLAWNKFIGEVVRTWHDNDWFSEHGISTMDYKNNIECITHWMPLPNPPESNP